MAESLVSRVMFKLSELLSQEEFILLHGRHLHDELDWMRDELQILKCYIKDAEAKVIRRDDQEVKDWVKEVIRVAFEAEDAIDNFLVKVKPHRQLIRGFPAGCCINRYKPSTLIARLHFVMEIGKIKKKLNKLRARREIYGIQNLREDGDIVSLPVMRRRYFSYEPDDIVVNYFEGKALLEDLLDHQNETRVSVNKIKRFPKIKNETSFIICIYGEEDGMGKTTLARRLYRSNKVGQHFDIRIWLTISRFESIMERLENILENIPGITKMELENMHSNLNPENSRAGRELVENYLIDRLNDSLKSKRYLIVLDDFRPEMLDDWKQYFQRAFPDVNNGSKVLITSTTSFAFLKEARTYQIRPSNEFGISRFLLLKKAGFTDQQVEISNRRPNQPFDVNKELTTICKELQPLALILLGGFLSMKEKRRVVWVQVLERLNKCESEGRTKLKEILALSYEDLPWFVKRCFLYLIAFPEGYEIKADILVKLWVAEGFILQEGKTMEDTGEAILEELAQRSLVKVTELRHDGSINKCIVHRVLLDLARSDCYTNVIKFIWDGRRRTSQVYARNDPGQDVRFLAIHVAMYQEDMPKLIETIRGASMLWTLMVFTKHFHPFVNFFMQLPFVRVLELSGVQLPSKLPKEMGSMIHLRYLGLRDQDLESLPSTIGNLRFLETIDMRNTICSGIPDALWKIKSLRHVLIDYVRPPQILDLSNLHTFEVVSLELSHISYTQLQWSFPNLRTFNVWIDEEHHGRMLVSVLSELEHLISLTISVDPRRNEAEILDPVIINMKNFPFHQHLQSLCVQGRLPTAPIIFLNNHEFPSCLTYLQLSHSQLEQDPMPALERLQHLVYLKLSHEVYTGTKMVCSAGGFPLLKHLVIREFAMPNLEEWHVKEGAMPILALLQLYSCHNLKMFPDLQNVKSLRELKLDFLSTELNSRLQSYPKGEDWHKIQHVRKITIYNSPSHDISLHLSPELSD